MIPLDNPTLMIATGVGVKNTIDLSSTIKYALDTIPMLNIIEVGFYLLVLGNIGTLILKKSKGLPVNMAAVVLRLAAGGGHLWTDLCAGHRAAFSPGPASTS